MEVKSSLFKKIEAFCRINGVEDVEGYVNTLLERSFMEDQYEAPPVDGAVPYGAPPARPKKEAVKPKATVDVPVATTPTEEKVVGVPEMPPSEEVEKKKRRKRELPSR